MATYLVIKNNQEIKSYKCKETEPAKPYIRISNSYLGLTNQTTTGLQLKVKVGDKNYIPIQTTTTSVESTTKKWSSSTNNSNLVVSDQYSEYGVYSATFNFYAYDYKTYTWYWKSRGTWGPSGTYWYYKTTRGPYQSTDTYYSQSNMGGINLATSNWTTHWWNTWSGYYFITSTQSNSSWKWAYSNSEIMLNYNKTTPYRQGTSSRYVAHLLTQRLSTYTWGHFTLTTSVSSTTEG